MDATKFPPRVLLDTEVFIRALEHGSDPHKDHPRTKDCRDLWVTLLRNDDRTQTLIAAPTVLEFMRGQKVLEEPPVLPGVIYASYDYRVAVNMSQWATKEAISEVRDRHDNTRRVVTYDALIVGTARAYSADCVISYDEDVAKLAAKAGIECREPSYFRPNPTLFGRT